MKHCCILLAIALATVLQAAVPARWTVTPGSPPHALPPVPHGAAIDFEITLKGFTDPPIAPDADLRLWYQTNNMGDVWFSAPAEISSNVISASWGPAQDTGADRVSLFFGAPSNVFASAVLRLTHAPGFVPATITPAVKVLDFNLIAWTNAPWTTASDVQTQISTKRDYHDFNVRGAPTKANGGWFTVNGAVTRYSPYYEELYGAEAWSFPVLRRSDGTYIIPPYGGTSSEFRLTEADKWEHTYEWEGNTIHVVGYVGTLATSSEIPAAVTNVVREIQGLVYDESLGVTWKQTMYDGNLYYIAVTNANITEVK